MAGAVALLVGVVVWAAPGERAGGFGHRPEEPAATTLPTAPPEEAVPGLLAARDRALVARDAAALAATSVPGGAAAEADEALLAALQDSATTLADLRTEVLAVEHVTAADDTAVVDAVLLQHPHERRVGEATVDVPAPDPRCTRLVLAADAGQWRIERTEPCPGTATGPAPGGADPVGRE